MQSVEPSALTAQTCRFAQGDDGWSTVPPTESTSTASLVESGSKPVDAARLSNKYGFLETGISGKASGAGCDVPIDTLAHTIQAIIGATLPPNSRVQYLMCTG